MKNDRYSQIVFTKGDYDGDIDKLFEAVGTQLKLLLNAGYVAVVRYDEPGLGIVEIQFEHDEYLDPWGGYTPVWITEEEEQLIMNKEESND